ncbi:MAG: LysR family transcriptional regulator [Rhodobacter sp.]|nr:LysR family transcriptional regulator [Rhodobacter sp.]
MNHLKLRHFRLIQAIAETEQLSVAAERVGITQPAASRTLKEIEKSLGQPVFERHPKGMTATPIGQVLARHSRTLMTDLVQAQEELRAFDAGEAGAVRVGAVTGAAVGYVVPAIQQLGADQADISVEVAPSTDLMDGLLNGELDFILSRVPGGTDIRRLLILGGRVEELRFLVRTGHPLLERRGLSIGELGGLTWVTQAPGMPIRNAVEQAFLSENCPPPSEVINSSSLLLMTAYLQSSDAVTAVATEVAELLDATRNGRFRALHMQKSIVMGPYHLIREQTRRMNPLAERLLALVAQAMADH